MARIAITGGTGFVGLHTAKALLAAGHEVRLVARGERGGPRPEGATLVRADVVTGTGLTEAFDACDTAVHLVAVIRERGKQTFERVNAAGTENAVRAAREAGVGHFIHLSAIGADPDPRYAYLAAKWQGEQFVMGAGVPYTILRSSLVFGPGDGFFTVLTRMVRLAPVVPIVGDGRALFQPIAAGDLARIIVECAARGPQQRVIEVGGPDQLTYEEIVDIIKTEVGAHRLKVHVPVPMMVPLAVVFDKLLPNPPVTPGQLRLLEKSNVTRPDAVPDAFGFAPLRFADNCAYLQNY
ncbi:MAG TPA: NAD-dependent epimerase/dehydratase family protein [Candidatus Dormibacteraeota bacterium]